MTTTDESRCPACGVPFTEHAGLIPTCKRLRALLKTHDTIALRCRYILEMCKGEREMKDEARAILKLLGVPE